MTSTDPAATTLATMSPTMIRALHKVNDGHAHHIHGREISSLTHRSLIEIDLYGCVVITTLGTQVLNLIKAAPTTGG